MPIVLSDLFSAPEANVLSAAANALAFEDGRSTAGTVARAVKNNTQAGPGGRPGDGRDAVLEKIRATLMANPLFQAAAIPKSLAGMMVTRTADDGYYGPHIDNALMAGGRSDLSFTLFLSEPETYDGGALCISDRVEERQFKLPLGQAIVYPTTSLHRVAPVTSGARLVVVGWVTSWVRDAGQREVLFDLWCAISRAEAADDAEQVLLLSKARSNLLRMWAT